MRVLYITIVTLLFFSINNAWSAKIAWDTRVIFPKAQYTKFKLLMEKKSHHMINVGDSLLDEIQHSDVLMIGAYNQPYDLREIEGIKHYVNNGGNLLVLCDAFQFPKMSTTLRSLNKILQPYGIICQKEMTDYYYAQINEFHQGSVFGMISSPVFFHKGIAKLKVNTNKKTMIIAKTARNKILIAGNEGHGKQGKILVFSDIHVFRDQYLNETKSHPLMASLALIWLSKPKHCEMDNSPSSCLPNCITRYGRINGFLDKIKSKINHIKVPKSTTYGNIIELCSSETLIRKGATAFSERFNMLNTLMPADIKKIDQCKNQFHQWLQEKNKRLALGAINKKFALFFQNINKNYDNIDTDWDSSIVSVKNETRKSKKKKDYYNEKLEQFQALCLVNPHYKKRVSKSCDLKTSLPSCLPICVQRYGGAHNFIVQYKEKMGDLENVRKSISKLMNKSFLGCHKNINYSALITSLTKNKRLLQEKLNHYWRKHQCFIQYTQWLHKKQTHFPKESKILGALNTSALKNEIQALELIKLKNLLDKQIDKQIKEYQEFADTIEALCQ